MTLSTRAFGVRAKKAAIWLARKAAIILTLFLTLVFLTGQWFSLPKEADTAVRVLWAFLLLGLIAYVRASWKPSPRLKRAIEEGKWWLIAGAGFLFSLMGALGVGIAPVIPGLSEGLVVFFVGLSLMLLFQGLMMLSWSRKHLPSAKVSPDNST